MDPAEATGGGRAEGERVGTVFVVKEDQEYCFLFKENAPARLFAALFECAERPDLGLSRGEVFQAIEGMVPDRLREI